MTDQRSARILLQLWRGAVVEMVRKSGPDLSARQMAVMLEVYLTAPPHTVRGLAKSLNISKPAVVRALDALGRLGFTRRKRDEKDRRSVNVLRTVKGSVYLAEMASTIQSAAELAEAAE